jgi:hypothetical protein
MNPTKRVNSCAQEGSTVHAPHLAAEKKDQYQTD